MRVTKPSAEMIRTRSAGSLLKEGSTGPEVRDLQRQLQAHGFNPGPIDGDFGPKTRAAVVAFQKSAGLDPDGVVGPLTRRALEKSGGAKPPPSTGGSGGPISGPRYTARGTGYYPDSSALEGGFVDRQGKPLRTLQDYLAGKAPYVSVAMDPKAFPYGTHLRIPELEKKYGRAIDFRVVDTGGAFMGKGTSRIDICTKNERASLDPTINGKLTLVKVDHAPSARDTFEP